jgi:hypothetical protein
MRVESFTSTNGLTRYILVDSSGVPVDVVLRFLRFKDNCGRARNTLRAYAQAFLTFRASASWMASRTIKNPCRTSFRAIDICVSSC